MSPWVGPVVFTPAWRRRSDAEAGESRVMPKGFGR
jgi:hypothetical protein